MNAFVHWVVGDRVDLQDAEEWRRAAMLVSFAVVALVIPAGMLGLHFAGAIWIGGGTSAPQYISMGALKEAVLALNGTIGVESEPGRGTCFRCRVPLQGIRYGVMEQAFACPGPPR